MRFMSELEAVKRMAEAQVMASRVREAKERERRHLIGPHVFDDGSVVL